MSAARIVWALAVGPLWLGGCSGGTDTADSADGLPDVSRAERVCGHPDTGLYDTCGPGDFCVETRGALCMPLPPPGQSCSVGCVLTEHCCNCSGFACVAASPEVCPGGPGCACFDDLEPFSLRCPAERRECTESGDGVTVLCIEVDFDEDPFADEG